LINRFILILLNKSKFQSFDFLHDVLKSLQSNINSLGKKTIKCDDTQQADNVEEIHYQFFFIKNFSFR
jgi:hypothetical protein